MGLHYHRPDCESGSVIEKLFNKLEAVVRRLPESRRRQLMGELADETEEHTKENHSEENEFQRASDR